MKATNGLCAAVLVLGAIGCERPADPLTGPAGMWAAKAGLTGSIGINVLLAGPPTAAQLAELATFGKISDKLSQLNVVFLRASVSALPAIQALPYVLAANPDAERTGAPVDAVAVSDFATGLSTWDLDVVNVTPAPGATTRSVPFSGAGVYVGVLDTGLLDSWRQVFPEERIAEEYAVAFGGGGALDNGATPERPNVWEHDQYAHGTHVTSTILGYQYRLNPNTGLPNLINGVAPLATVIPVKVLNQNGSGWSSTVARGIVYIADLKAGPLAGHPVVINMSLGGPALDAVERAAIDYAIARGVILVASAGNAGSAGMGYPGAYAPVISVAASGWVGEWVACTDPPSPGVWWRLCDVAEPTTAADFYIAGFSSRELPGQDLDVAAPGSWVVGPFQFRNFRLEYFFLGGTSMSSPHVAGIVALMAQKHPALTAPQAEDILTSTAIPLPAGSRMIRNPNGTTSPVSWGDDATGSGLATADAALAATP